MVHSLPVQFLRFGVVGVIGFVVNAGLVEWLARDVGPIWAQCLAFPVAVTVTWWLNRRYTFGASGRAIHHEWLRFVLANSLGWLANNGTYFWLVLNVGWAFDRPSLAVAAGSLAGMFLNFGASRWIVFKRAR